MQLLASGIRDVTLLKVLDAVPFRLFLNDGVEAARRRLRELPRRPVRPGLRVANRIILARPATWRWVPCRYG